MNLVRWMVLLVLAVGMASAGMAQSWNTDASNMPTSRQGLSSSTGPNGDIYAIGGGDSNGGVVGTVERYDPDTDSWSTVSSMPTSRERLTSSTGPNGNIYAIGGQDSNGNTLDTVEKYNPRTDSWSTVSSMPTSRQRLSSSVGPDGNIYVIGGEDSNFNSLNVVERYDPDSDSWSTVSSMPTSRGSLTSNTGPNGNIYAIGGQGRNFNPLGTVEKYDPVSDSWSAVSSMPTSRRFLSSSVGPDGNIYAIGGQDSNFDTVDVVEKYNPSTDSWSTVSSMPTVRRSLTSSTGPNGFIYAIGGDGNTGNLDTVEILSFNVAPVFDSSSVSPDRPFIGETADFSYTAKDPTGIISSVDLVLKDDGTQIFSGSKSSATGNFSPPDKLTKGTITAEFTATDNNGATTTTTLTRNLVDTAPSVSLGAPTGEVFDYDQDLQVNTQVDGDSRPDESLQCVLSLDSTQIDQRTVTEGTTYTVNDRADLGTHNADVTCTETDDQQTDSGSIGFTVEEFQVNSLSGVSQVFETEDTSFTADLKAGDMVNSVESELFYDSNLADSKTRNISGISDFTESLSHTVGLVQNNKTSQNFKTRHTVEYTGFNGNRQTTTVNSSSQSQEVLHAYSFNQHKLADGFTQLEASTLDYTTSLSKDFVNAKGTTQAQLSYSQTGQTLEGLKENRTHFTQTFDSNLIQSKTESFDLEANFTVSFNEDSRNIVDSRSLTLEKIQLSKSSSTGPKTLQFETRDEINNSLLDANVEAGITVNNPDQPGKTRFFGFDFSKDKKHELFLSPSDASITANVFDERSIAYENLDQGFPSRRHYLTDTILDNETTNINLYLLEQSKGQTVRFELTNSDLQGLSNHLIRVERAFPDQNKTRTVQLAKTGTEGFASTFLQLQERYIFTVFDENGDLVDQVGPETVTTSDKRIQVNDEIDPSLANVLNDVQFTDIQRGNQSLSVSYVSETQRLNNLFLKISSDGLFETKTLDVDSSEQPQGQLQVTDFNASEQRVFFELIGTFGETNLTLESGTFGQESNDLGNAGIFVSFLMFTALTLSGLFRPSAAIGLGVISIFVMSFTGFLAVGQQALISIAALAAVLIWRMSSQ